MISVCFFAELRERLDCAQLNIDNFSGQTIAQLLQIINTQHPQWDSIFAEKKWLIAVNHAIAKLTTTINDGDEVAFFPPVTGG